MRLHWALYAKSTYEFVMLTEQLQSNELHAHFSYGCVYIGLLRAEHLIYEIVMRAELHFAYCNPLNSMHASAMGAFTLGSIC